MKVVIQMINENNARILRIKKNMKEELAVFPIDEKVGLDQRLQDKDIFELIKVEK